MADVVTAQQNRALRTIVAEVMFLQETNMITDAQMHQIFALLPPTSSGTSLLPIPSATPAPGAHSMTPAVPHNIYSPPPVSATPAHERAIGAVPGPSQLNHHTVPVSHAPVSHSPITHAPPAYTPGSAAQSVVDEKEEKVVVLSVARAMWAFQGTETDDLNFQAHQLIEVTEKVKDDWWKGRVLGQKTQGLFPAAYVKELKSDELAEEQKRMGYGAGGNMMTDVAHAGSSGEEKEKKPSALEKHSRKFGGKLGNAAIFGAGATIGSNIVNGIF